MIRTDLQELIVLSKYLNDSRDASSNLIRYVNKLLGDIRVGIQEYVQIPDSLYALGYTKETGDWTLTLAVTQGLMRNSTPQRLDSVPLELRHHAIKSIPVLIEALVKSLRRN